MEIVFDERKREANLQKHGFDFGGLDEAFFKQANLFPAKLGRFMAVGWRGGEIVTVIFKQLGDEAFSVISMRSASRKERGLL
jgi:uncharacterized protein